MFFFLSIFVVLILIYSLIFFTKKLYSFFLAYVICCCFLVVIRDLKERGRDLPSVLNQYSQFVKPAFEEFCLPTKKYADVIIPRGAENEVAINLIVQVSQFPAKFYDKNDRNESSVKSDSSRMPYNDAVALIVAIDFSDSLMEQGMLAS